MSGVAVMVAVLRARAPLVAEVADRIIGDVLPGGTPLPALAVESISAVDRKVLKLGSLVRVTELVQVTIHAADADERILVHGLTRSAGRQVIGDIAGVTAVSVTTEGQGPDFTDDAGIKIRTQDFRISFNQPA